MTGDALRSVLDGLRLHLPRLASQQVMEDTCANDGRYENTRDQRLSNVYTHQRVLYVHLSCVFDSGSV